MSSRAARWPTPDCSASGRSRTSVNRPCAVTQNTRFGCDRIAAPVRRNSAAPRSDFVSTPTNPSFLKNAYCFTASASIAANWSRSANSATQHDADHRIPPRRVVQHDEQRLVAGGGNAAPDFDSRTAWKCLRT